MKHILLFVSLLLSSISAFGDVPNVDFGFLFNRLPGVPLARKYQLGNKLREMHTTAICQYDFGTLGGALGNINLVSPDLVTPCQIPGKAVIRNAFVDVTTNPASLGSATIAISSGKAAADIMNTTSIASFTVNRYQVTPTFATAGSWIKITATNSIVNGVNVNASQVYITVGTAALTAGIFRVYIDYVLGQ